MTLFNAHLLEKLRRCGKKKLFLWNTSNSCRAPSFKSKRRDFFPAFSEVNDSNIVRTMYNYSTSAVHYNITWLLYNSPGYWIRQHCDEAVQLCILSLGLSHPSGPDHPSVPHCSTSQRTLYEVPVECYMWSIEDHTPTTHTYTACITYCIQWNLCIMDTLGPIISVLIIKVSWFSRSVYMIRHHLGP